jgi:hypothetical protein
VHYRWLWGQTKRLAVAFIERLADLFHYQTGLARASNRQPHKPRVRAAKSETRQ